MNQVTINKEARLSKHLASPSEAALSHLNELNGLRLTPHFTLGELCKTNYETKDGNIPSHVHIENLKRLCTWLEQLREEWNLRYGEGNDPLLINSGYRSPEVNRLAGGCNTSNHLTGCAADIRVSGLEQAVRYATILLDLSDLRHEDFDELLIERSLRGNYWLHFAVRPPKEGNRRKTMFISC